MDLGGTRPEEKEAAIDYTASFYGDVGSVIVLDEDEDDKDEVFAGAPYWRCLA